jgi:DNA-binding response OmpR family regulator
VVSMRAVYEWRLPGCGPLCRQGVHDPLAHEDYGRRQELERQAGLVVRTGPLVIDRHHDLVWLDGAEVHLSEREWGVLAYLAEHADVWCVSTDVVGVAWGPEWVPSHDTLMRTCVNRLRMRLGPAGHLVETHPGRRRMRRLRVVEPT